MAELELGYWGIRGLGHPIRYILEYAEVPYKEVSGSIAKEWGASSSRSWRTIVAS